MNTVRIRAIRTAAGYPLKTMDSKILLRTQSRCDGPRRSCLKRQQKPCDL